MIVECDQCGASVKLAPYLNVCEAWTHPPLAWESDSQHEPCPLCQMYEALKRIQRELIDVAGQLQRSQEPRS